MKEVELFYTWNEYDRGAEVVVHDHYVRIVYTGFRLDTYLGAMFPWNYGGDFSWDEDLVDAIKYVRGVDRIYVSDWTKVNEHKLPSIVPDKSYRIIEEIDRDYGSRFSDVELATMPQFEI